MEHERFMREALDLAKQALLADEIPVGAVVVKDGKIIGRGRNRREADKNALAHAETEAIRSACQTLGDWRLTGCTLYVTLEPCLMCCGALLAARVSRVVFGAYDKDAGACVSRLQLEALPHQIAPQLIGGYLARESEALLQEMFENLRA